MADTPAPDAPAPAPDAAPAATAAPAAPPLAPALPGGGTNLDADTDAYKKVLPIDRELMRAKIGAEGAMAAEYDRRDKETRARMEHALSAEGASAADLKPWNADQEMAKHQTSMWDQFGSPGFIVAMLASAFTAQPMNSALAAGGAAMKAVKDNDQAGYEKAFEAWKTNTDLAIKRHNMEHQEFADIESLRTSDIAAWREKMTEILTRFDDKRKLALLDGGMDLELMNAISGQDKAVEQIVTAKNGILEQKTFSEAVLGNPKWKSGNPTLMQEALNEEHAKMAAAKTGFGSTFGSGAISEMGLHTMVDQYLAGDKSVLQNLGRGAQGAQNIARFRNMLSDTMNERGITGEMQAKTNQEFQAHSAGLAAAERTGGSTAANLDIIMRNAHAAIPQALEKADKVSRGTWVPVNQLLQWADSGLSNPELKEFKIANLQLAELWARAMNPRGVMRESDRELALSMLSTADTLETYKRVVASLKQFLEREQKSVSDFREGKPMDDAAGGDKVIRYDAQGNRVQ